MIIKDEQSEIFKKDEKTEMIAKLHYQFCLGKLKFWKTKILDKMLGENKPDLLDAVSRSWIIKDHFYETPDGHMVF